MSFLLFYSKTFIFINLKNFKKYNGKFYEFLSIFSILECRRNQYKYKKRMKYLKKRQYYILRISN